MSKKLFTEEAIYTLKDNKNITFISSKSISFTAEFKTKLATCKTLIDARELLEKENISTELLGYQRTKSTYERCRNQYRLKGSAAFTSEKRGRKRNSDKKTYTDASIEEKLKMAEQRIRAQEEEIETLKKFTVFLPKSCKKTDKFEAVYRFIEQGYYLHLNKTESLKLLCGYLKVSLSGYYKHISTKNNTTDKKAKNRKILDYIIDIQNMHFRKSKSKFKKIGYRQVTSLINKSMNFDYPVNHKRVYRLMKNSNLLSEYRRRNPYKEIPTITKEHKSYPNLINGNFESPYAYNILCTDITYLICNGFKAYLSAVKDSSTGKIIAYKVSSSLKMDFVIETIETLNEDLLNDETVIHSDQGGHYTSPQFSNLLVKKGITQSMSRRGKCTDNAPIESFFGHMKCELAYEDCKSIKELRMLIDSYIEYYNYERPQIQKNQMTPHEYECHLMNI